MVDIRISVLPLAVLSTANFLLSWIWYSPLLFGKPWMKALGIEGKREMSEEDKARMPFLFFSGIASSVLFIGALMVLVRSLDAASFPSGMLVGSLVWIGFVATHSLNTLWEGRRLTVLLINNGLFLLTYALFGGVLAVWK